MGGREEPAVAALRALVRIPTVSYPDEGRIDPNAFARLRGEVAQHFPLLWSSLEQTTICRDSLLLHWRGRADDRPVVLMAHQDVVPVDESADWQHPPFSAQLADGAVWGRGTLDDKGALVAICAAVEALLAEGFIPAQDVWLSFGAREEVSGVDAAEVVRALQGKGIRPWFVLDEGGAVAHQAFPGVEPPLGVVGVAEKGTTTLRVTAQGRGGHSSTPAPNGPTARIARAVVRLEKHPFPASLPAATVEMFRRIAPHASPALRPLMRYAGRLAPALSRALVLAGPEPAALVRTTMSVTELRGSPAHNVIASSASAAINLRLHLGDTIEGAIAHVRKAIGDDSLGIEVVDGNEPSAVSPIDDDAFELIERTITRVFPDAVPTPYVMMAATDSRFFTAICPRVYRFAPFRMTKAQRESIHSYDEHVGVEDFLAGVAWFRRLLGDLG